MQFEDESATEGAGDSRFGGPPEAAAAEGGGSPSGPSACSRSPDSSEDRRVAGASVHGYTILARLGWRRAGIAYEARTEESGRRVTMLLLPTPLAGAARIARFRRESERLLRLRHPSLQEVIAAGVWHRDGEALGYLVVPGEFCETLPEHLLQRRPDAASRVRLLAEVCEALEHAHRHGLAHGDLRASDILVGLDGRPRLCEVGILRLHRVMAEAIGEAPTAAAALPEAALPAEESFRDTLAIGEIARSVLAWGEDGTAPAGPAAGTLRQMLAAPPWTRHEGPRGVARALREAVGGSAGGVAMDDPAGQRRRRQQRRRRVQAAGLCVATGAACLAIGLAIGHLGDGPRHERRQRSVARMAGASEPAAVAEQEAPVSPRLGRLLAEDLPAALRSAGVGREVTFERALDLAAASLASDGWAATEGAAEASGEAHLALADAYEAIGADESAAAQWRSASHAFAGAAVAKRVDAESRLAMSLLRLRRFDEAIAVLAPAAAASERALGERSGLTRRLVHDLAVARFLRGEDAATAIAALNRLASQQASDRRDRLGGGEIASSLAAILEATGRIDEAAATLEASLAGELAASTPPIERASRRGRLASLRLAGGRPAEALSAAESAFAIACGELGWRHPATAEMASLLAAVADRSGDHRRAAAVASSALAAAPELPAAAGAGLELRRMQAAALARGGNLAAADAVVRSLLADLEAEAGRSHPLTLSVLASAAALRFEAGEEAEAAAIAAEGVRRRLEADPAERTELLRSVLDFSAIIARSERPGERHALAEALSREVASASGESHPATLAAGRAFAGVLREQGRLDEAVAILEAIAARAIASLPDDDPLPVHCRNDLAYALLLRGDLAASDEVLRDAWSRAAGRGPAFEPASRHIGQLARELVKRLRRTDGENAAETIAFWRERIAGGTPG